MRDGGLGRVPIEWIEINPKSRDDVPAIMLGLKALYCNETRRETLFQLFEKHVTPDKSRDKGRPGMSLWSIVVFRVLKAGLNLEWDRLEFHVEDSMLVPRMLGLGVLVDHVKPSRQTLIDNVSLLPRRC